LFFFRENKAWETKINLRDKRDVTRADSPLTIAEDAVVIDTSELDLTEVFEQMMSVVRESGKAKYETF
jgi:cytidylate kinase